MDKFEKRIMRYVRKSEDGCWLWGGTITSNRYGKHIYGQVCIDKDRFLVHRYVYEYCAGKIPSGYSVIHSCGHGLCVNPVHLQLASKTERNTYVPTERVVISDYDRHIGFFTKKKDDCVVWTRKTKQVRIGKKTYSIRNYIYEKEHGKIPKGSRIVSSCGEPNCLTHLELKNTVLGEKQLSKTHCPQGHEYNKENTMYLYNKRRCRICYTQTQKDYRERNAKSRTV